MARSRLAEIYKQEKIEGRGITSAVVKRLGEKLNPRQIFDRSGVVTTMFPALKSYRATPEQAKTPTAPSSLPSLSMDTNQLSLITEATKITAKNSIVLPSMARDMFLMKQNIIKLVKATGKKPQTKDGDFLSRQFAREAAFEQQMASMGRKSGSVGVNNRDGDGQEAGGSFLDKIGAIFGFPTFRKNPPVPSTSQPKQPKGQYRDPKTGRFAKRPPPATTVSRLGGLTTTLARALPFLGTTLAPVLGIAGLAGLFYHMIKKDTGQGLTTDDINQETGLNFTPEQSAKVNQSSPATNDELRKARENMRASDDPDVRAAAAKLDITNPLPARRVDNQIAANQTPVSPSTPAPAPAPAPAPSQAGVRRVDNQIAANQTPVSPSTPAPVPTNVVRSGFGEPIMTGFGGYLTSGETSTTPTQDLSIGDAINNAASTTGVPAQTLAIFGQLESSLGKNVIAQTSTARGPFQFIEKTWLSMLKKYGKEYGYDPSSMTREEQLNLRYNNRASAIMAAELAKENSKILGINPSDPTNVDELYLAHFLGPDRAKNVLSGKGLSEEQKASIMKSNPNIKTGSKEEFLQFAQGRTAQAAKVAAVRQIVAAAPATGAMVASASTSVADGRRSSGGGGNVVVDASQKTTLASAPTTEKPASAYDKDIVDAIVSSAYT
jgi:hypothetical protein